MSQSRQQKKLTKSFKQRLMAVIECKRIHINMKNNKIWDLVLINYMYLWPKTYGFIYKQKSMLHFPNKTRSPH